MLKNVIFILMLLITLTSCGSNIKTNNSLSTSDDKVIELNAEIKRLNDVNNQLKDKLNSFNEINDKPINVSYISYKQQSRFVSDTKELLWMPADNSPIAHDILPNTLVKVLLAGCTTEDDIWLFVSIPVYDTASNCYGWIRESDTQKYTKENQKLLTENIIIPKGTKGKYPDGNVGEVYDYDNTGKIEKRENGRVLVMFAGGNEIWYDEKDIQYPPIN